MRPRQSRLGIRQELPLPRVRRNRFNEAEAITPRNPAERAGKRSPGPGFNEAEAITPRNHVGEVEGPGRSAARFNEAEAITPRNQVVEAAEGLGVHPASMRPRQSRLGIRVAPGPELHRVGSASMRPRQSRLGIQGSRSPMLSYVPTASMRPRQSRLGIRAPCSCGGPGEGASFNEAEAITPRNLLDHCIEASQRVLSFNEAEAITPRNRDKRRGIVYYDDSFNEAEAITPRNLAHGRPHLGPQLLLQ